MATLDMVAESIDVEPSSLLSPAEDASRTSSMSTIKLSHEAIPVYLCTVVRREGQPENDASLVVAPTRFRFDERVLFRVKLRINSLIAEEREVLTALMPFWDMPQEVQSWPTEYTRRSRTPLPPAAVIEGMSEAVKIVHTFWTRKSITYVWRVSEGAATTAFWSHVRTPQSDQIVPLTRQDLFAQGKWKIAFEDVLQVLRPVMVKVAKMEPPVDMMASKDHIRQTERIQKAAEAEKANLMNEERNRFDQTVSQMKEKEVQMEKEVLDLQEELRKLRSQNQAAMTTLQTANAELEKSNCMMRRELTATKLQLLQCMEDGAKRRIELSRDLFERHVTEAVENLQRRRQEIMAFTSQLGITIVNTATEVIFLPWTLFRTTKLGIETTIFCMSAI